MVQKLLKKLERDELEDLSKFFYDLSKGILGAPLVIYLILGFPVLVLVIMFMINFMLALGVVILAIYLKRYSKRKNKNG